MTPTLVLALLAPAAVAVFAAIIWAIVGAAGGLVVLFVGWGAMLVHHLHNLDRLTRWAGGSLDSPVPEGKGSWRPAFSAGLVTGTFT